MPIEELDELLERQIRIGTDVPGVERRLVPDMHRPFVDPEAATVAAAFPFEFGSAGGVEKTSRTLQATAAPDAGKVLARGEVI